MDATCERREIGIRSAYDNSPVLDLMSMKLFEMQTIVRQNSAACSGRERQDLSIRYLLAGRPRLEGSENIVSHFSKKPYRSKWKILVRVKISHDWRIPRRHPVPGYFGRSQLCDVDNNLGPT
jgi:hypothetical protein